jgi:hypothetical protein
VSSSFFDTGRFTLAELVSSPPFPLPDATSPPTDVAMPSRRIVLPSHGAKASSLPPLNVPATLDPVASPHELKSKY